MSDLYDQIETILDTFSWSYQDGDQTRGEIVLDREHDTLVLTVWCHDNESTDEEVAPLTVTQRVTDRHPQDQIRELIHGYLCHEADEQMYFDGVRVYYPH